MVARAEERVHMRTNARILLLLAAAVLPVACGSPAPERGAQASGPGAELYERNCAMCHGIDGVASRIGRGAVDLNDRAWQERTSEQQIADVIANGRGQMPAWRNRLSDEEIRALAAHVKTLK